MAALTADFRAGTDDFRRVLVGRLNGQKERCWPAEDRVQWERDGTAEMIRAACYIRVASLRIIAAKLAGQSSLECNAGRQSIEAVRRSHDALDRIAAAAARG